MPKEFARKKTPVKEKSAISTYQKPMLGVIIILIVGLLFFWFHTSLFNIFTIVREIPAKFKHLQLAAKQSDTTPSEAIIDTATAKHKKLAQQNQNHNKIKPPIHFEFYTALSEKDNLFKILGNDNMNNNASNKKPKMIVAADELDQELLKMQQEVKKR